jgi:hypothetical protein
MRKDFVTSSVFTGNIAYFNCFRLAEVALCDGRTCLLCRLWKTVGSVASLVAVSHYHQLVSHESSSAENMFGYWEWLLVQVEDIPICLDCSELATTVCTEAEPPSPDDLSSDCNCSENVYSARLECCCHPATPFADASG